LVTRQRPQAAASRADDPHSDHACQSAFRRAVAAVFSAEGPDIKARWDQRQQQLTDIRIRLAQIHERRGACTHEMQTLAADRQMGKARLELGTVEVQLTDAIRRWKVLAIIGRLLEAVRCRYETDRQPETLREASQYLVRLTDGAYTRVWMPLDRRGLLVENEAGESLPLDVLSRGTREAVFIGLRLALAGSFARRGATLPLVLDDVLVNFDSERVRCAADVLCDFARQGHQVIMFTCHEHITDIFEDAEADIRILPARDGSVRVRRRRPPALDLPPPTPPAIPDEPEPIRIAPEIDPNPLFQEAAEEQPLFDPVHPLPERIVKLPPEPKPKRRKKLKLELPDYWPIAELPAPSVAPPREPVKLQLPDHWPLAPLPEPRLPEPSVAEPIPRQPLPEPQPLPEAFEVLAFRYQPEPEQEPRTITFSGPDRTPPPPKHARRQRQRFAWESPEMYWEE
jgi:hypothetical protein